MGATETALAVLMGTAVATALYAWWLNSIHHLYAPDWIWLTVVGGNALIGGMFALWLGLDPLPAATFAAFWRLLALNVAAGVPIIAWQIGQANARPKSRQRREPHRGPDDPRGPGAA